MNWFYNLLIGIGSLMIGFLAFADEIAIKIKLLKPLKSLLFKIPIFLFGTIIIICATIAKDYDNDKRNEAESEQHIYELREIDSTNRANNRTTDSMTQIKIQNIIDSSYLKSIKASNDALAKYNLIYIDSLKTVVNKINTNAPMAQLTVAAVENSMPPLYISEEGGMKILNTKITSVNNTSYNIGIDFYIGTIINKKFYLLQKSIDSFNKYFLVPGRTRTLGFQLNDEVLSQNNLFVFIIGSFTREENSNDIIKFEDGYTFNFKENKLVGKIPFKYDASKNIITK